MAKHGYLVLVRHGESRLNKLNRFTGWIDIPLSEAGIKEASQCAEHCRRFDYHAAFTSHLERAHETLLIILSHQRRIGVFQHEDKRYNGLTYAPPEFIKKTFPIFADIQLNERAYGELQGLNKNTAARTYGKSQVLQWRRGFKDRPPKGESLKDVYERVIPYFEKEIHPRVNRGETILIAAHGNTLRAVIKFLEHIDDDQIPFVDLPTAHPLVYSCIKDQFTRIEGEYRFNRPLR